MLGTMQNNKKKEVSVPAVTIQLLCTEACSALVYINTNLANTRWFWISPPYLQSVELFKSNTYVHTTFHCIFFFVFKATARHVGSKKNTIQHETVLLWISYLHSLPMNWQILNLTGSVFYISWSLQSAETKAHFLKASYSLSTTIWNFQALLILTDHEIMIHNTIKSQGLLSCHKEMHWLQQTCNGYADLISSFQFEILFDWSIGTNGDEKSKLKTT